MLGIANGESGVPANRSEVGALNHVSIFGMQFPKKKVGRKRVGSYGAASVLANRLAEVRLHDGSASQCFEAVIPQMLCVVEAAAECTKWQLGEEYANHPLREQNREAWQKALALEVERLGDMWRTRGFRQKVAAGL